MPLRRLLLVLAAHIATGCLNNQLYFGRLTSSLELESFSLRDGSTACNCCGLCSQNAACLSFTLDKNSRQCTLYSAVGGPAEFNRDSRWNHHNQFFFKPNSSRTGEFCRSDRDCVTTGDACRGRICTADPTVTCRDLHQINSELPDHRYWAYIADKEMLVKCSMRRGGYTLLLNASPSARWTVQSRLNLTSYEEDGTPDTDGLYSILWAADHIRDSSPDATYSVFVGGTRVDDNGSDNWRDWTFNYRGIFFTPTKDVSLLGGVPLSLPYTVEDSESFQYSDGIGQVSFPYLQDNGSPILMHANTDAASPFGGLIRTGGPIRWSPPADYPDDVYIYIRE
ncbi:uncharacterized protein LOC122366743 [Amphibalanus amphitrite]|uniref:uncharacterized protein LOC122366743 n=1 Tax=Amphibalanus amphitrite TaxID=1232801 RepID=UPI001C90D54B|nr:uncharacterized protein LOC122366743 [Amphibalanus amphitrite]XP_043195218.1 uncharacterized protein LOC122366743 [Amphibalanus amphitrite]XP_043195219.1 uncharacterized protein LOC122366743 [Amphibalanus amphitrite]